MYRVLMVVATAMSTRYFRSWARPRRTGTGNRALLDRLGPAELGITHPTSVLPVEEQIADL
jgi:hypothetical protein